MTVELSCYTQGSEDLTSGELQIIPASLFLYENMPKMKVESYLLCKQIKRTDC